MKHNNLLIVPGLIVGVAALGYVSHRAGQVATSNAVNAALLPASTASPKPGMITVREYLAAYWGAKWPELEAQIPTDKQHLLDELVDPGLIPSWETVGPIIRASIQEGFQSQRGQWIEDLRDRGRDAILTGAIMGSAARSLTPSDTLKLQAIVDRYAPDLEALAAQSFDFIVEAEEAVWDQERYCACPLIELCSDTKGSRRGELTVQRCFSSTSWVVSYVVDSSEWMELERTLHELSVLKDQRQHDAIKYLSAF